VLKRSKQINCWRSHIEVEERLQMHGSLYEQKAKIMRKEAKKEERKECTFMPTCHRNGPDLDASSSQNNKDLAPFVNAEGIKTPSCFASDSQKGSPSKVFTKLYKDASERDLTTRAKIRQEIDLCKSQSAAQEKRL
jgi:hypothetical protein